MVSAYRRNIQSQLYTFRWLTLGNQLGPDQIHEEDMAARIRAR